MNQSRRNFIKRSAIASAGMLVIPQIAKAAITSEATQTNALAAKIKLKKDSVILFQGDSITDAGRDRSDTTPTSMKQLGYGYPLFTSSQLLGSIAPDLNLQIHNRGISGHKVFQLIERWQQDCIDLKPDILSILIGVNDHWHTLSNGYKGTPEIYEADFRKLLKITKENLPDTQLVICEPFTVKDGTAIVKEKWYPIFDEYRRIAHMLANEFNTIFVPYQSAFDKALQHAPASYWAKDGVHPDLPGRQLMADVWLESTGLKEMK